MATATSAARARAPRRAELRVVRGDERVRAVGTIGSMVAGFFFLVLFVLAGLHAVVVQTQAELDAVDAHIVELEERRDEAEEARARADSPEGLSAVAAELGLVPAPEVVFLTPVAPGGLTAPATDDPFAGAPTE
jgi:hypothetical protein